jgi:hypothetical protein
MSSHIWNSIGERTTLMEMIQLAFGMLLEDDDVSMASFDSINTLHDIVIPHIIAYTSYIYAPMVDYTIPFGMPDKLISDFNDSQCHHFFRFRQHELQMITNQLWFGLQFYLVGNKEKIICSNRYSVAYETGLCILLYRLSTPSLFQSDMERIFCSRKSRLAAIVKTFSSAMHRYCLPYFANPVIFSHRFPLYARLIHRKSNGAASNIWGFIDGTLRRTSRPSRFQRLHYSGHKRSHGIKFQSVVTPDGLIACLFGPVPGSRHDAFIIGESGLLDQLEELMPPGNPVYTLYGDSAYAQMHLVLGGFRNPIPHTRQAEWNGQMSSVRESVEWMFGRITALWSYLDFSRSMRVFKSPVHEYYMIGAFMSNLHCIMYANQTADYFQCTTTNGKMSLEEYLGLVQHE